MLFKNRTLLFADTTVNVDPSSEELAEIAILSAEMASSSACSRAWPCSRSPISQRPPSLSSKVARAVDIARTRKPTWPSTRDARRHRRGARNALQHVLLQPAWGSCEYPDFPNLDSGNTPITHDRTGGAKAVGPLLMGLSKPFNVLQRNTDMESVVNVITVTVVQARYLDFSKARCDFSR